MKGEAVWMFGRVQASRSGQRQRSTERNKLKPSGTKRGTRRAEEERSAHFQSGMSASTMALGIRG